VAAVKNSRMMKNYTLVAGITLLLSMSLANVVLADSGARSYVWIAGAEPLCTVVGPEACPDVARASNGDTVSIAGSGTFTIHPDSVTGSGTFIHKDSAGNVKASGTWTATQLVSFVSYGSASLQGLPPNFEGGKAVIRVHASVGVDAILTVYCVLGSPPSGVDEGIRLNVQNIINFNTQAGGTTIFIRTA
jgi:hypothetical protein